MNPDTITQFFQKGVHVTLGATTALVESLQDAQKRDENMSKLSSDFDGLVEDLAVKGEITEQEARRMVESMFAQVNGSMSNSTAASGTPPNPIVNTTATVVPDPAVQADLQELTAQIAAMRAEIERLKNEGSADM
ncbi:MAG: hypothetical protein ACTS2F_05960 [Thainema sp.]